MAPLVRNAGFVVCGLALVQICVFQISGAQTVGKQEDEAGFLRKVVTPPEEESKLGSELLQPAEAQDNDGANGSPAARRLQTLKESFPEEIDEATWEQLLSLPKEEMDDGAVAERRLSMDNEDIVEPADEASELDEPIDTTVEENTEPLDTAVEENTGDGFRRLSADIESPIAPDEDVSEEVKEEDINEEQVVRRLLALDEELEEEEEPLDEVKDQEEVDAQQLVRRLLASEEELEDEEEPHDEMKQQEDMDEEQFVRRLLASEEELEEKEPRDEVKQQEDIDEEQLLRSLLPSEEKLDEEELQGERGPAAARQLAAEQESAAEEFEGNQFTESNGSDPAFLQELESAGVLTRRLLGEDDDLAQENAAETLGEVLVDAMDPENSGMSENDLSEIAEAVKDAVEELNRDVQSVALPDHGAQLRRLSTFLEGGVNGIGDLNTLLDLASQSVKSVENEVDATAGDADKTVGEDDSASASAGGKYHEAAGRTKAAGRELQVALRMLLKSLGGVLLEGPVAQAQSSAGVLKNKLIDGGEQLGKATVDAREQMKQSFLRMLANALVTIAKYNPDLISMALRVHEQAQREAEKPREAN